jgi:hypothetical protein
MTGIDEKVRQSRALVHRSPQEPEPVVTVANTDTAEPVAVAVANASAEHDSSAREDTDTEQPAPKKRKRTRKTSPAAARQNDEAGTKDSSTPSDAPGTATSAIIGSPTLSTTGAMMASPPNAGHTQNPDQVPPPLPTDMGMTFASNFDWNTLPPLTDENGNLLMFPYGTDDAALLPVPDYGPNALGNMVYPPSPNLSTFPSSPSNTSTSFRPSSPPYAQDIPTPGFSTFGGSSPISDFQSPLPAAVWADQQAMTPASYFKVPPQSMLFSGELGLYMSSIDE